MEKKKILLVIAHKEFRDEEFLIPKSVFENNGYSVDIISDKIGIAEGSLGYKINIDKTINDINSIIDYCCISIVGGAGVKKYLYNNNSLIDLISKFYNNNKVISAICISPILFAKANLLKNKKVTFFKNDEEAVNIMKKSFCLIENKNVVSDGNIVTADGPNSALDYGVEVINILKRNYKNENEYIK